jgi:hypothetical protein
MVYIHLILQCVATMVIVLDLINVLAMLDIQDPSVTFQFAMEYQVVSLECVLTRVLV